MTTAAQLSREPVAADDLSGSPLQAVLKRLPGHKRAGSGWLAKCPVHDDQRPSLSINEGEDGRVLLHCYAGCSIEQIAQELGLTLADLFAKKGRAGATVYPYTDEDGVVLYEVVRRPGKRIGVRRPHPDGGYIHGVSAGLYVRRGADWRSTKDAAGATRFEAVRRVLYRLPELLNAPATERVVLVEGEKDADRLRSLGFLATCHAFGANGWRDCYAPTLADRPVVIVRDMDEPGKRWMCRVAASLLTVAAEVRAVELPDLPVGGDVSDWLDAGHAVAELRELADAARPLTAEQLATFDDHAFHQDTQGDQVSQVTQGLQDEQGKKNDYVRERKLSDGTGRGPSLDQVVEKASADVAAARGSAAAESRQMFNFARAVKAHPALGGLQGLDVLPEVRAALYRVAGPDAWMDRFGLTEEEAEAAFVRSFDDAYSGIGESLLDGIVAKAAADLRPFSPDWPTYRHFLTTVALLQQLKGPAGTLLISTQQFARRLGVSHATIGNYRKIAELKGYLALVRPHCWTRGGGRCAEYRFDLSRLPPQGERQAHRADATNPNAMPIELKLPANIAAHQAAMRTERGDLSGSQISVAVGDHCGSISAASAGEGGTPAPGGGSRCAEAESSCD